MFLVDMHFFCLLPWVCPGQIPYSQQEASKAVQVHMRAQWKHFSATTIICQCHKEASLNNSSGEIKSAETQSKWRKCKWRVNENIQGKDVQAAGETNVFAGTWLLLLRIPFSADRSPWISRRTLSEEHVAL